MFLCRTKIEGFIQKVDEEIIGENKSIKLTNEIWIYYFNGAGQTYESWVNCTNLPWGLLK